MSKLIFTAVIVITAVIPQTTWAQTLAQTEVTSAPFEAVLPIANSDLNAITGQSDLAQVVRAENNSVVSGNTVSGNSQTGVINFDGGAFQNLNGLSLLSANTGNNVSINSSLNVNVAINR